MKAWLQSDMQARSTAWQIRMDGGKVAIAPHEPWQRRKTAKISRDWTDGSRVIEMRRSSAAWQAEGRRRSLQEPARSGRAGFEEAEMPAWQLALVLD
jgi:hypothetical protein